MRTLVVSAKETNRRSLLRAATRTSHCTTVTPAAPREVYSLLKNEWFDLVLVDWGTPADLDVLRFLRSNWIYSRTPVLVASESSMPDDVLEAVNAGADVFLIKPLTPKKLARRLDVLIRMYSDADGERPLASPEDVAALLTDGTEDDEE